MKMKMKRYIILDGTSSTGKTMVCKYFSKFGYNCLSSDEYNNRMVNEFLKNIPNKFMNKNLIYDKLAEKSRRLLVKDAKKGDKSIIDDVDQTQILKYFTSKDKFFIIVIYSGLSDLARNINNRRKEGDLRGLNVFRQFSWRYISCNKDEDYIDIVNLPEFKAILNRYLKYEFENRQQLDTFANDIFNNMGIKDNKKHYIKLRNQYKYNYVLNTTNKTKNDIFKELGKFIY
jgi:hypothetical protein